MRIDARAAVAGDASEIANLHAHARDIAQTQKGGKLLLVDEARIDRAAVSAGPRTTIVGTIDGIVVGYANVWWRELADQSLVAEMDEIFVVPPARGVGVGSAILRVVTSWAKENGCDYLESVVLPGARASKNFFEAAGMVTRLLRVSTPLSSGNEP